MILGDFNSASEAELGEWLNARVGVELFRRDSGYLQYFKQIREEVIRRSIRIVTVGGTNGKGETCFALAHLIATQQSVALWTSPHVLSLRERFFIAGNYIGYQELFEQFVKCQELAQVLSYYEFLFYVFCTLALQKESNYWVLEVGLGGRLDAVNLFAPCLTAIVSIGRDHQEILGNSYIKILHEKLGITRKSVPLLSALELKYCRQYVERYCRERSIPWSDLFAMDLLNCADDYSRQNRILAQQLYRQLFGQIPPDINFSSKGREELVAYRGKSFVFIGSHNFAGIQKLTARDLSTFDGILVSCSKRSFQDLTNCIRLFGKYKNCVLTSFTHPKAADTLELNKIAQDWGIPFVSDWREYLGDFKGKRMLITGSYYFVGEVQRFINCE